MINPVAQSPKQRLFLWIPSAYLLPLSLPAESYPPQPLLLTLGKSFPKSDSFPVSLLQDCGIGYLVNSPHDARGTRRSTERTGRSQLSSLPCSAPSFWENSRRGSSRGFLGGRVFWNWRDGSSILMRRPVGEITGNGWVRPRPMTCGMRKQASGNCSRCFLDILSRGR